MGIELRRLRSPGNNSNHAANVNNDGNINSNGNNVNNSNNGIRPDLQKHARNYVQEKIIRAQCKGILLPSGNPGKTHAGRSGKRKIPFSCFMKNTFLPAP